MDDVAVDVLEAVVAHATNQEPRSNVGILFDGEWILALTSSIYVECSEMARELASVFCN